MRATLSVLRRADALWLTLLGGLVYANSVQNPFVFEIRSSSSTTYQAHNNLGIALRQLGRPHEATGHYRQALELNPDFADAHYNLANALVDLDDLAAAETHYRQALGINPGYAKAHNNLGKLLGSKGMTVSGMHHFGKALALNPEYAEAHFNLGTAYLLEDQLEAAVIHYRRAVELDADNPLWLQYLSRALRKQVELGAIERLNSPMP